MLKRLKAQEPAALEALMDQYSLYVLKIVSSVLRPAMTQEDIEEVTADVFLALWRSAGSIRTPEALKGYLAKTARNQALNKLRAYRETAELEEATLVVEMPSMDDALSQQEQRWAVQATLAQLPEPDREIFLRHYYYCQTLTVIAQEMGMGLSAVKSRLSRGRQKLKTELEKGGTYHEV